MNVKEFEPVTGQSAHALNGRGKARPSSNPGLGPTLLGVICVAGVFGVLGLLYALG